MKLTNRQQQKQDDHFCYIWKHQHTKKNVNNKWWKLLKSICLKKTNTKDQISIKSRMNVLKIKHYEHNTASGGIENEALQA